MILGIFFTGLILLIFAIVAVILYTAFHYDISTTTDEQCDCFFCDTEEP